MGNVASPRIARCEWGRIELEGGRTFKDAKLFPGGAREWDWREAGTHHVPGIQPTDIRELLVQGAEELVLSRGMELALEVHPDTLKLIEAQGLRVHVLETLDAIRLYNELIRTRRVGALFHSTC
ncbi:MAG TPA: Mth938-like domain-containing protein [Gammaproteobacteria bacterium]|nr:Mth938-like domain-containing protein [Gammaproteobacteria bacterium]